MKIVYVFFYAEHYLQGVAVKRNYHRLKFLKKK